MFASETWIIGEDDILPIVCIWEEDVTKNLWLKTVMDAE